MRRSVQFSQNFLKPSAALEALVATSAIQPSDTVLDIGAGSGALTMLLAAQANQVVAIEADPRLADNLRAQFAHAVYVQVVTADFLEYPLPTTPYAVFANIPFNQTSAIIHKLLDAPNPPTNCYLVIQREAAEKFAGRSGQQSLFAILHAPWFSIRIIHEFQSTDFIPQPKVTTVLLHCQLRAAPMVPGSQRAPYEDFVTYIFNHANPNILPSLQILFGPEQFIELLAAFGAQTTAKPSQVAPTAWLTAFKLFQASADPAQHALIRGAAAKHGHEAGTIEKHHRTRSARNWRDV